MKRLSAMSERVAPPAAPPVGVRTTQATRSFWKDCAEGDCAARVPVYTARPSRSGAAPRAAVAAGRFRHSMKKGLVRGLQGGSDPGGVLELRPRAKGVLAATCGFLHAGIAPGFGTARRLQKTPTR